MYKRQATAFAEAGADVAIVDLDIEEAKKTAKELAEKTGRKVIAIQTDCTDKEQVDAMVKQVVEELGGLEMCIRDSLSCMGAKPLYLTCAFVIEEGFPMEKLEEIAEAMEKTAKEAGVRIVSGDTKVAGKGQVDGVFITTTGIGEITDGVEVAGNLAKPGDAIIVTGDIGRHGCTILLAREDFGIDADVTSDCAPLWGNVEAVMDATHELHVIRDATRGGVGTVLYEIAGQSLSLIHI